MRLWRRKAMWARSLQPSWNRCWLRREVMLKMKRTWSKRTQQLVRPRFEQKRQQSRWASRFTSTWRCTVHLCHHLIASTERACRHCGDSWIWCVFETKIWGALQMLLDQTVIKWVCSSKYCFTSADMFTSVLTNDMYKQKHAYTLLTCDVYKQLWTDSVLKGAIRCFVDLFFINSDLLISVLTNCV